MILTQIGSDITILTGLRDAKLMNTFCNSVGLRAIDLSDILQLSWNEKLSSLITTSTLSLINDNIFCTAKGISKSNRGCFLWIDLIGKNTKRISFKSLEDIKNQMTNISTGTAYIAFNETNIFIARDNTGTSGCIGDRRPQTHTDSIKDGLRVSFYNSIGKMIHKKIDIMRDETDKIFLSLIELSTVNLIDPTLKITKMDENELKRMCLSLIPVEMTRCRSDPKISITSGILVGFNNYTINSTEIKFWSQISKIITGDKYMMRSELIRTYISTLNLHRSVKRRINNLQISYGAPKVQIDQPINMLWSSTTKIEDLACFCNLILSKSCPTTILEKVFHLLNRDKMAAKRDILYSLNLDPDEFKFPDLNLKRKVRQDKIQPLHGRMIETTTTQSNEINGIQNDDPGKYDVIRHDSISFRNLDIATSSTPETRSQHGLTTTWSPSIDQDNSIFYTTSSEYLLNQMIPNRYDTLPLSSTNINERMQNDDIQQGLPDHRDELQLTKSYHSGTSVDDKQKQHPFSHSQLSLQQNKNSAQLQLQHIY